MEDDPRFFILHGCKLARELESNLPSLLSGGRRGSTKTTCEEIVRVFGAAADNLTTTKGGEFNKKRCFALEGGIDGMDIVKEADLAIGSGFSSSSSFPKGDGDRNLHPRKRRSRRSGRVEGERTMKRVPAPRYGNTNVPEEDGHTWRKYGQKRILGSKFPRAYYRCTHQRLYQCPAKKQVQRLDHDPNTFQVTYQGHHTCLMSSTAPLLPPQQPKLELGLGRPRIDSNQPRRISPLSTQLCPSISDGPYTVASMAGTMFNSSGFKGMDSIFASKEDAPATTNKKD